MDYDEKNSELFDFIVTNYDINQKNFQTQFSHSNFRFPEVIWKFRIS
ncbi:MAG: hypothetical protein ACD_79C00784G0001, partial [uncultured bacterium]